jgi:hypothetical protein
MFMMVSRNGATGAGELCAGARRCRGSATFFATVMEGFALSRTVLAASRFEHDQLPQLLHLCHGLHRWARMDGDYGPSVQSVKSAVKISGRSIEERRGAYTFGRCCPAKKKRARLGPLCERVRVNGSDPPPQDAQGGHAKGEKGQSVAGIGDPGGRRINPLQRHIVEDGPEVVAA